MNQNLNSIVQQCSDDEYTSHNELPVNCFFNISLDNIPSEMSGEYDLKADQMKLGLDFDICEYFGRLDQAITKENSSSNNELVNEIDHQYKTKKIDEYSEALNFSYDEDQPCLFEENNECQFLKDNDSIMSHIKEASNVDDIITPNTISHSNKIDQSKLKADDTISNISNIKDSLQSRRLKRWLKEQDRELFVIICELISSHSVNEDVLSLDITQSKECKRIWKLIKSKIVTDRNAAFLQMRYLKLIKHQSFSSKDLNLLSFHYDKMSIEKLMIMFPGKSKDTITKMINSFKAKSEETKIKETKLELEMEKLEEITNYSLGILS